jgi:tripartite-type tricarboxylate transporter receptor subunit TctC
MRSLLTLLGILGACNRASPDIFHQPAAAQPTPYYDGKMIRIIGRLSSGGEYDQYARILARHMPKYIPGSPNISVKTCRPRDHSPPPIMFMVSPKLI